MECTSPSPLLTQFSTLLWAALFSQLFLVHSHCYSAKRSLNCVRTFGTCRNDHMTVLQGQLLRTIDAVIWSLACVHIWTLAGGQNQRQFLAFYPMVMQRKLDKILSVYWNVHHSTPLCSGRYLLNVKFQLHTKIFPIQLHYTLVGNYWRSKLNCILKLQPLKVKYQLHTFTIQLQYTLVSTYWK